MRVGTEAVRQGVAVVTGHTMYLRSGQNESLGVRGKGRSRVDEWDRRAPRRESQWARQEGVAGCDAGNRGRDGVAGRVMTGWFPREEAARIAGEREAGKQKPGLEALPENV